MFALGHRKKFGDDLAAAAAAIANGAAAPNSASASSTLITVDQKSSMISPSQLRASGSASAQVPGNRHCKSSLHLLLLNQVLLITNSVNDAQRRARLHLLYWMAPLIDPRKLS